jgi:MoxR-like ATPase
MAITIDQWELAEKCVGNLRRVLLYGPPGTGKTYAAMHYNLTPDQPMYTNTLTEETPASELRGHYIMTEGSYKWMHGPAIRSWLDGARYVLNELDRASGDCHSICYAILDDQPSAQLTLPNGETVKPQPNTNFVITMNGNESDLPEALIDRMDAIIKITRPHPAALAALPEDLRKIADEATSSENPRTRTSVRKWFAFADARSKMDVVSACVAVFGERAQDIINAYELQSRL